MKMDFTTRLSSAMSQTTLNATVLASMAELCTAFDTTKLDKNNLHPQARLYGGQFGTVDGDRLSLEADGFGVPTEAFKDAQVTAVPMGSASAGDRAFATERGQPGTRGMMLSAKSWLLRGEVSVTVNNAAATASVTINWNTDVAPTVTENRPAGWTSLANIMIHLCPSTTNWFSGAGPTYQIGAWRQVGAPTDTGFTVEVHHYSWDTVTHVSSDYTTGARTFKLAWFATGTHA